MYFCIKCFCHTAGSLQQRVHLNLIDKYWDGLGNPHWGGWDGSLGWVRYGAPIRPYSAKNGKYIWDFYFRVIKGQRMAKSRPGAGDGQVFMLVSVVQGKHKDKHYYTQTQMVWCRKLPNVNVYE